MNIEAIKNLLAAALADCEIRLESEGNHLTVTAIGELFEGKRAVQRQQQVYAILNKYIADGTIHAVNLRLYTPSEWQSA